MRRTAITLLITFAVLLGSAGVSWSADLDKGFAAHKRGDYKTALREFKPLAKQGHADAQNNLGEMFYNGLGVVQDFKTAVKWLTLSAEQGYADAQYNLGLMYASGQGVEQDYAKAVEWYQKAADQGHAKAQFGLGIAYGKGQGLPRDLLKAYTWIEISSVNGAPTGQVRIELFGLKAAGMKSSQITKAEALAKEMIAKNPQLIKKKE